MPNFLTRDELLTLENFHIRLELTDARIAQLRENDSYRALRSEMLTERINAIRLEIESLKLPDKKLYDTLVMRVAERERLQGENKVFVDSLKEKYDFPLEEDFGFDPDTGQIVTREEERLGLDDQPVN